MLRKAYKGVRPGNDRCDPAIAGQRIYLTHTKIAPIAKKPAKGMAGVLEYLAPNGKWVTATWPRPARPLRASIRRSDEKGSDVNLATYLLLDAAQHDCDEAVVLSGDSDLQTPIAFARTVYGLRVTVINPTANRPSAELQAAASTYTTLQPAILPACRLSAVVYDSAGRGIRKPGTW